MEWVLGLFTTMAVMAAIISGGTGVRLMYIDGEYRKIISAVEKQREESATQGTGEQPKTKPSAADAAKSAPYRQRLTYEEDISDLHGKRDANRRGVVSDGICVVLILIIGLTTALGFSQSPIIPAILAFTFFLTAMIPFYYHARTVICRDY